jgi:GT2 family glycosyltransferase
MLAETLQSLLAQEAHVPYEVVVVDNNSRDETKRTVEALAEVSAGRLRYVFEGAQGQAAARNAGVAVARGEHIAFTDDDVTALPGWLSALAATYEAYPDAWCVGGRIALGLPEARPAWFDSTSRMLTGYLSHLDYGSGTIRLQYPYAPYGANVSVTRAALARVGGFDARLGRIGTRLLCSEDVELCLRIHRAGGGVYFCSDAVVVHRIPPSRLTKRYFRERAYWQGRTDAVLWPRADRPIALGHLLGRRLPLMTKDAAKALGHTVRCNIREAFEHEIAAWKELGYLRQSVAGTFVRRRQPGGLQ